MLKMLKQDYGVNHFKATVNDSNTRSIKLLRKIGFREISRTTIDGGKNELAFEYQVPIQPE